MGRGELFLGLAVWPDPRRTLDGHQLKLAKEMDAHCQQAIIDNHHWTQEWSTRRCTPPHIFGDVTQQFAPGSMDAHQEFEVRKQQLQECMLSPSQFCYTHGGECPLGVQTDVDMSGLPCQDNSRANPRRKYFGGKNGSCYLAWARKHSLLQTPLLIVENVPDT